MGKSKRRERGAGATAQQGEIVNVDVAAATEVSSASDAVETTRLVAEVLTEARRLLESATDAGESDRTKLHTQVWELLKEHVAPLDLLCSRHRVTFPEYWHRRTKLTRVGELLYEARVEIRADKCSPSIEWLVGTLLDKLNVQVEAPVTGIVEREARLERARVDVAQDDSDLAALVALQKAGGKVGGATALAKLLGIDRANVYPRLRRLTKTGDVRPRPKNHKRKPIEISPKGRQRAEAEITARDATKPATV